MKIRAPWVLLTAFLTRTIHLQGRSLWYDEAFAVLYSSLSPGRMVYGTVTPAQGAGAADVHPLLYYSLLHGWMELAGRSPLVVRFLSVMLGMITVAVLWRLASWCFGSRTGLVVGLLAAVNPFHVAYSQETRMYALLGLGAVVAAWGLLRALEGGTREQGSGGAGEQGSKGARRKKQEAGEQRSRGAREQGSKGAGERGSRGRYATRNIPSRACRGTQHVSRFTSYVSRFTFHVLGHWSLFVVGSAVTLYAHNLGAFVLLALHLLVIVRPRWRRHLPRLALADLFVLLLFSPWLVKVLPGQVSFVERGYWLSAPGLVEVVRIVMLPVLTFYEPAPPWLLGIGLFAGLLLLALLMMQAWRSCSRVRWFLLLCWIPILSLLSISYWRPVYLERALLPSALFYLVAIGWLLTRGKLPRILRLGLAALLAATTLGSLGVHYTYAGFPRPPFPEAAAHLRTHVEPDDAVVHTNKLTYFPMHYYAPDVSGVFLADPAGSPQDTLARPTQEALGIFATANITEAVEEAERVWLVTFPREVEQVRALGADHPAMAWLEDRFVREGEEQFGDLSLVLYREEGPR